MRGIPEGTGDLFQPFGERRGTGRSGLGLGLSIARKAVHAHHGDIVVHNMPGKGCVFAIDVPLAAAADAPLFDLGGAVEELGPPDAPQCAQLLCEGASRL